MFPGVVLVPVQVQVQVQSLFLAGDIGRSSFRRSCLLTCGRGGRDVVRLLLFFHWLQGCEIVPTYLECCEPAQNQVTDRVPLLPI